MAKGVWGIDVSKSSVKVVRLEGDTLTHSGVFPYDSEGPGEGGDIDAQIKAALTQIKATMKISSEPVIFSLPSHSTFNRLIKLPPVEESKIPEIVKYEAQSQIPFNIDEVIWDYQYVERDYGPGEEKEVILFAIKRDIVEQFLANIADLKFNTEAVQFAPVALFNFLLHDQEVKGATVALDMGGDNTDLIVIDGTKFWVRNLPITGNDITKALQKAFNIPFEEAEKLKLKAGQSQQAQKIFNAVQPILRDLVNEINRSMGYYKSISKTSKFDQIILLGNSTKTLNFQKFVSQSLQLPAVRLQKLNTIAVGGSVDPGELNENLATIGTAIGLALQGIEPTTNRVNLLPEVYRQKKQLKRKQPFVIATAAALYLLVGLAWYKQDTEVDKLDRSIRDAEKSLTANKAIKEEYDNARKVEEVRDNVTPLVELSFERDLILKIMDEINPNIPNNGDEKLTEDQRLWVVDWRFEEKPKETVAPPTGQKPQGEGRHFPASKIMTATLEVVVSKKSSDQAARNFIINTLLNYNDSTRQPMNAGKPCVLKNSKWELVGGASTNFWRVEQEATDLQWPVPKAYAGEKLDTTEAKNYWRYNVTLEMPVSEEARKAASAPAK
ncbi:MAG TPA: type IV pilus assembly protein PilM [Planctomycetota bacterium]|nr:type IV pilus assembly protein PilM [Planctomycetota bacterium]